MAGEGVAEVAFVVVAAFVAVVVVVVVGLVTVGMAAAAVAVVGVGLVTIGPGAFDGQPGIWRLRASNARRASNGPGKNHRQESNRP